MMADLALAAYEGLDREAARCFRLLVLHPGPDLSVDAAAAIVGCTPGAAARRCAQLVAADLAAAAPARDGMPSRYRVPAEIGEQACAIADTAPDCDELRARLAQWYLAGAHTADEVLTPWRRRDRIQITGLPADVVRLPSYDAALEWLEAEKDSLAAVVTDLADQQPLLAWQIADALSPLYLLRGTPVLRRRLEQNALDCAEQLADPRRTAQALLRYGEALHEHGEPAQALALLRASRDAATRSHDMWGIAAATEAMAIAASSMGAHDEAYYLLTPQRAAFMHLGDLRRAAVTDLHIAAVHHARGEIDQAIAVLADAETLLHAPDAAPDPYTQAMVDIARGRTLIARGEHETARELLVGALITMTTLHALAGQAHAMHHLGELALACGDTALAQTRLHSAVRLFTACGNDYQAAVVARLIAARHPDSGSGPATRGSA
ncbi:hypothetical protein [Catenuloplanes japonicus]|uniref:hypothetical protein n=1 Tax=Catenuloplanes japonicus TaxID=33876 RepID=UPI000AEFE5E3|nr:hypothetical protein [Catenuloplanes japonicus]